MHKNYILQQIYQKSNVYKPKIRDDLLIRLQRLGNFKIDTSIPQLQQMILFKIKFFPDPLYTIRALISFFMHLRRDLHFLITYLWIIAFFGSKFDTQKPTELVYRWLLRSSCLLGERCLILLLPLTCVWRKRPDKTLGLPLGVVNGLGWPVFTWPMTYWAQPSYKGKLLPILRLFVSALVKFL